MVEKCQFALADGDNRVSALSRIALGANTKVLLVEDSKLLG